MKLFLRMAVTVFFILGTVIGAHASAYDFNGFWVDVEAWVGNGENETILVVDWNCLDNGEDTISESHAFGYRWDGTAYELDMLLAFDTAGILDVTNDGGWLLNIGYEDEDGETHLHTEAGSWNLGSTSDPYGNWGGMDYNTWEFVSDWDMNPNLMDTEPLTDGQFEGINAIVFYSSTPSYANDQLDIPFADSVPVPAAIWLLGSGLLGLIGTRRRK